jgi:hypothetical protein
VNFSGMGVQESDAGVGSAGSAKNALLEWVRSKIPEYDITNFTSKYDGCCRLEWKEQ